jgi:hypothetical protein
LIGSGRAAAGAWRVGAALLACAWLAGCGVSGDPADGSAYLDRVGGALGQDLVPAPEPQGPAWPLRRELLVAIPRIEIDAGEFIDLHGCDMGALVGFRNSPLGRTQSASQRLGYEATWLAAVRRCGDAAPDWLRELVARKDAQLPALFWNALFAGDELRVAAGASRPESPADLAQLLRALRDHRQAIGRGDFDVAGFETTLAGLGSASWIGHARRDWTGWRTRLDAVRAALDANRATICRNGRPTPRSRILANVFARFYIGGLQPRLAERMQAHEAWVRELAGFATELEEVATPAFRDWFTHVVDPATASSEWRRTRHSVVEHANAWQRLFDACGLDPRSAVGQD